MDWEGIPPTTEWLAEIRAAIEACDNFLFVISPESSTSKVCRLELDHAIQHRKRLIPVVARETAPDEIPAVLAPLNWIFFQDSANFQSSFKTLIAALDTDYDWVRAHTRLLVRARQWETKGRDNAFLLRGSDLREAETWLGSGAANRNESLPTALHAEYITISRKAATKRLRFLVSGVSLALVVAVVLAVLALIQRKQAVNNAELADRNATEARQNADEARRNADEARRNAAAAEQRRKEAEEQRRIAVEQRDTARSRELATTSILTLRSDPEASVHLAVEAARIRPTLQAEQTLREALREHHLQRVFEGLGTNVRTLAFSPDGRLLATAGGPNAQFGSDADSDLTVRIWEVATGKLLFGLKGHTGTVQRVQFNPDGTRLITAGDFAALIWDTRTGVKLVELRNPDRQFVRDAQFSPDGQLAVTANWDDDQEEKSAARVWDVSTGKIVATLAGHKSVLTGASFSPNGKRVVTASVDDTARVFQLPGGTLQFVLTGHKERLSVAAFSPDGRRILTAGWDHTARLWDAATGKSLAILAGHTDPVVAAAFTPDSRRVATASRDGAARVWNTANGAVIAELRGHTGVINSLCFSPNSQWLLTVADDGTGRVWEANTPGAAQSVDPDMFLETKQTGWRTVALLAGHTAGISSAAFSPDGTLIATGSADRTARIWKPQISQPSTNVAAGRSVERAVFSPNGKYIIVSNRIGITDHIDVWEIAGGCKVVEDARSADFSLHGGLAATSQDGSTTTIWDTVSGRSLATLAGGRARFTPDGKWVVTEGAYWSRVWKVGNWGPGSELPGINAVFDPHSSRLATVEHGIVWIWKPRRTSWQRESGIAFGGFSDSAVEFLGDSRIFIKTEIRDIVSGTVLSRLTDGQLTPDKRWIVSTWGGGLNFWDTQRGVKATRIEDPGDDRIQVLAISPDSRLIAGANKTAVWVWEMGSWRNIAVLRGHLARVVDLQFSPDSRLLATASEDKTARVWDIAAERTIAEMRAHKSELKSVAFSSDGRRVLTLDDDEIAHVYSCDVCGPLPDLLHLAGERLSRPFTPAQRASYLNESRPESLSAEEFTSRGRELASTGDLKGAIEAFNEARRRGARLANSDPLARSTFAESLLEKGRSQAKRQEIAQAIGTFEQARSIWPQSLKDPTAEARKFGAQGLYERGQVLAREGRLAESEAFYRRGLRMQGEPEAKARQLARDAAAEPYWRNASAQVDAFDPEAARVSLRRANELSPASVPDPEKQLAEMFGEVAKKAIERLPDGTPENARSALDYINSHSVLIPHVPARMWNSICWNLALDRTPAEALEACDRAVNLAPDRHRYRDSRGVARARTRNTKGALEDFAAYLAGTTTPKNKARRQRWVEALTAGKDPFTETEIKELRSPDLDEIEVERF